MDVDRVTIIGDIADVDRKPFDIHHGIMNARFCRFGFLVGPGRKRVWRTTTAHKQHPYCDYARPFARVGNHYSISEKIRSSVEMAASSPS
jgi:hypothetical protein